MKDPTFQSTEPDFLEICKFPNLGKIKAGTIPRTTFERKGQSLVSTETQPIGRAATHSTFSYANIAKGY